MNTKIMRIILNGFPEDVAQGCTIRHLIDEFEEYDHALIVEVNGRYVYPKEYDTFQVHDGDRVETIHPAFGG